MSTLRTVQARAVIARALSCTNQALAQQVFGRHPARRHTMLPTQLAGGKTVADLLLFTMSLFFLYH
jgi:hypothetical protein